MWAKETSNEIRRRYCNREQEKPRPTGAGREGNQKAPARAHRNMLVQRRKKGKLPIPRKRPSPSKREKKKRGRQWDAGWIGKKCKATKKFGDLERGVQKGGDSNSARGNGTGAGPRQTYKKKKGKADGKKTPVRKNSVPPYPRPPNT